MNGDSSLLDKNNALAQSFNDCTSKSNEEIAEDLGMLSFQLKCRINIRYASVRVFMYNCLFIFNFFSDKY